MDVGPGDIVECVVECNERSEGILAHWLCGAELVVGRLYTILEVVEDIDNFGILDFGFVLVEQDTHFPRSKDGELGAWHHAHFRPVYRREAGAFDHLLTPIDERVPA